MSFYKKLRACATHGIYYFFFYAEGVDFETVTTQGFGLHLDKRKCMQKYRNIFMQIHAHAKSSQNFRKILASEKRIQMSADNSNQ